MYIQSLKKIIINGKMRKADVARAAGVSRAAVTKWFTSAKKSPDGWANLETGTLRNLARGLGIKPEALLREPPDLSGLGSRLLWDHLYDSMEAFVRALARRESVAIGRLVQVLGFHEASHIVGKNVFRRFPEYKKYLKPVRKKELEILWPLYNPSPFTIDVVLDENLHRVGTAHRTKDGVLVADLPTLFGSKVEAGNQFDAGLTPETLLIGLQGATLRKDACSFVIPGSGMTSDRAFDQIVSLRKRLIEQVLEFDKKQPLSKDARRLSQAVKEERRRS